MAGNSERICKNILEMMFGKPFLKVKPAWLMNDRGKRMELDGFCEELQIAFEYHGVQHYRYIDHFHRRDKSLEQRQIDDERKQLLCREYGVCLLVIPYTVEVTDVPRLVADFAQANGLFTEVTNPDEVAVAKFVLPERLKAMQALAKENGGRCLSSDYINNNTPLTWECDKGHIWRAVPGSIQQGSWCPKCAGRIKGADALQQLQRLAEAKGGECLAEKYENGSVKLLWRCAEGHEWLAAAQYIRGGSWCHECAKKTQGPKRMGLVVCQAAAAAHGGQCLSDTYSNTDTKMLWKCGDCGHEWKSIPYSVVRLGTWCPKCRGKRSWNTRRNRED
jgi:thiol-disulfide isomerase/thioredoxin